ncbi:MAG: 4Fe-4S binding protein [Anaerolineae bacterium]|nr:4Fe-4S binding protein [Anaerolineae bacterium]
MAKHQTKTSRPFRYWIFARKVIQYTALAGFITLLVVTRANRGGAIASHIPMHIDPLVMLAQFLSNRIFLLGSTLAIVIILLTLLLGRAWCGWLCPLGTLLDLFPLRKQHKDQPSPPETLRKAKYGLLLITLFAALLGNLTLLVFDPLTILYRTITLSIYPAIDQIISAIERLLYPIPLFAAPISALDTLLRPIILPVEPLYYRQAVLYAVILAGIVFLNAFAPRFWCRYICPLGGLLGLVSKLAIFRRQVKPGCASCGLCNRACPTGTINPQKEYASDPSECTLCLECFQACPSGETRLQFSLKPAAWQCYDPSRRDLLTYGLAAVGAVGILNADARTTHPHPHLLRPPGADNQRILSRCIRCGVCIRACPTGALHPAITESGLEGLWTPILIPALGFCDYSCNTCGLACPVEAIPPLPLEEKNRQIIGKAYIDENRCIPWSDHTPCIVCEEMCPVPQKAIILEEVALDKPDGQTTILQRPRVIRERCIGCGICEHRCPVNGEAAIRVYIANQPF